MATKAVFYAAYNGSAALWVTDGTEAGTALLTTIGSSTEEPPVAFGDQVLFTAPFPMQPFAGGMGVTNGIPSGTSIITPPANFIPSIGSQFFVTGATAGHEVVVEDKPGEPDGLLVTDGTSAGTKTLSFPTVPPIFNWGIDTPLYSLGNVVIFGAGNTNAHFSGLVYDLWVSNGTSAGTMALPVPGEAVSGLNPRNITVLGNKAVFVSASGDSLWATDGTVVGTFQIVTPTLPASSLVDSFLALGDKALFEAAGTDNESSLWITDGTDAGTQELAIALPNPVSFGNKSLDPSLLFSFGNKALFFGSDQQNNLDLWVTDGTVAGTQELSVPDLGYFTNATDRTNFVAYGNKALFNGLDSIGKNGLWITGGTSAGTYEIVPATADFGGIDPTDFALAGNNVVFRGFDATGGSGLWTTNGTAAGTFEITNPSTSSTGSFAVSDLTSFSVPVAILFQNDNGQLALWQTSGATITASSGIGPNPGPSWFAMGTGAFFSGDTSDVVWQNQNGSVDVWQIQGTTLLSAGLLAANPGPTWHIKGTGDFYGDSHTDILWQNGSGAVAIWDMNGNTILSDSVLATNPGPTWHIKGTGDFYNDGHTDILWQNDSGAVAIWDMNGSTVKQSGVVAANPGPTWRIKGTGDFYGNGHTDDILWQNDNGAVAIWDMNGTTILSNNVLSLNPGPTWHIVGTGDFNNDGKTDIAWQNDNGSIVTWEMNGTTILSDKLLTNPGTSWNVCGGDAPRFIYSAAANETLAATPTTPDEFVLTSFAVGTHTIAGFNPVQDLIEFSGAQFASFAAVQGATTAIAGGSMIHLGSGSSLLLPGVAPASLHASDFALT